jgi:hypothetical protein
MHKRRLPMQASTYGVGTEKTLGKEGREVGNEGLKETLGKKSCLILLKDKLL